jgi:hypothetical protein
LVPCRLPDAQEFVADVCAVQHADQLQAAPCVTAAYRAAARPAIWLVIAHTAGINELDPRPATK